MSSETINHVRCPHCKTAFRALPEHAGRRAKCSHCGGTILVPGEAIKPPPPPIEATAPQYAGVNCSLCGTRMYGTLADVGKELKCPDCGRMTKLPPPEIKKKHMPAALEGEQYELWEGDDQPWGVVLSAEGPKYLAVECRLCQTHLQATLDMAGKKIRCHECGAETLVKLPPTGARVKSRPPKPVEEYDVDESSPPPKSPLLSFYRTEAEDAKTAISNKQVAKRSDTIQKKTIDAEFEPRPTLPRWPLVTGTLTFMRTPGVPSRWIVMSFWFTIIVGLVSAALATLATVSGGILGAPTAIKGMLFLISGVIIGCIWSLAMAAIALAIVTDSSEGSDEIQNWPTSVFMDWLTDLIAFLVALLVSAFPGWLIAKVSSAPVDETALFIGASVLACLPIVVLSQLAHDSMFAVLSPGILGSWFRCPLSWFGFWLHAAAVAGLVGGAAYLAFFVSGWFILLFGPLAVAGLIYYCRVMGRLAWVIAETSPEVGDEEDESSAR